MSLRTLQRRIAANARLGKDQALLQLLPEDGRASSSPLIKTIASSLA